MFILKGLYFFYFNIDFIHFLIVVINIFSVHLNLFFFRCLLCFLFMKILCKTFIPKFLLSSLLNKNRKYSLSLIEIVIILYFSCPIKNHELIIFVSTKIMFHRCQVEIMRIKFHFDWKIQNLKRLKKSFITWTYLIMFGRCAFDFHT